jgi:hypothetical protein
VAPCFLNFSTMEVGGQLHVLAALPCRGKNPLPIGYEAG